MSKKTNGSKKAAATIKKPATKKKQQQVQAAETMAEQPTNTGHPIEEAAVATRDGNGEWVGPVGEALKRGKQVVAEAAKDETDAEGAAAAKPKRVTDGLAAMKVDELQKLYLEVVGRPTGSEHIGYMVWKIREVRKGKIAPGQTKRAAKSTVPMKTIPFRIETAAVELMDKLAEGLGLTRNGLMRRMVEQFADGRRSSDDPENARSLLAILQAE